MSTQGSRRLRLALSALGAVGLVYLAALAALQGAVRAAESSGTVYPYRQEDWLRYLPATLWPDDGRTLILLTGPSTARENLLVEEFATAFPGYRAFQGSLSLGTLADVIVSLEYVGRVHGAGALPDMLVLGVSPRFLAEIPDARPFALGLDRYSSRFRLADSAGTESVLEPKSRLEGGLAQLRFLTTHQTGRYRAALAWSVSRLLSSEVGSSALGGLVDRLIGSAPGRLFLPPRAAEIGLAAFAAEIVSPYKYRNAARLGDARLAQWLDAPDSWWKDVHRWDPGPDSIAVRARVRRLLDFAGRHGIDVFVVSLPERSISRTRYAEGFDARFHRFAMAVFEPLPVLDLRCLLDDREFRDAEHASVHGARRTTAHTIRHIESLTGLSDTEREGAAFAVPSLHPRDCAWVTGSGPGP